MRPSFSDNASHAAATGSAQRAMPPSLRPMNCRLSNAQRIGGVRAAIDHDVDQVLGLVFLLAADAP